MLRSLLPHPPRPRHKAALCTGIHGRRARLVGAATAQLGPHTLRFGHKMSPGHCLPTHDLVGSLEPSSRRLPMILCAAAVPLM